MLQEYAAYTYVGVWGSNFGARLSCVRVETPRPALSGGWPLSNSWLVDVVAALFDGRFDLLPASLFFSA